MDAPLRKPGSLDYFGCAGYLGLLGFSGFPKSRGSTWLMVSKHSRCLNLIPMNNEGHFS